MVLIFLSDFWHLVLSLPRLSLATSHLKLSAYLPFPSAGHTHYNVDCFERKPKSIPTDIPVITQDLYSVLFLPFPPHKEAYAAAFQQQIFPNIHSNCGFVIYLFTDPTYLTSPPLLCDVVHCPAAFGADGTFSSHPKTLFLVLVA